MWGWSQKGPLSFPCIRKPILDLEEKSFGGGGGGGQEHASDLKKS